MLILRAWVTPPIQEKSVGYNEERKMQEKIVELRRTILFLCNTMTNAADLISKDSSMAKMILKDAVNDNRYEFK